LRNSIVCGVDHYCLNLVVEGCKEPDDVVKQLPTFHGKKPTYILINEHSRLEFFEKPEILSKELGSRVL
jgi:hypothetical protein